MALVETLFQHLPLECHLGILYDIGCQAERSCQLKKAGKDAVNELIQLRETQNDLKKRVKEYDAIIADVDSPPDEYADAWTELESVRSKLEELRTRIRRKQAVLGAGNCTRLTNLINDPFLALQMQTLALKQQLHDRLRFHRFELD
ncbi:hypothetical protein DXG01_008528 [Tephrocybe rancida]|nr:hypothetical protein DXG01_008528 [Tephrocybe rancida]